MVKKNAKARVLIVEDDPFISDIYVVELENRGYDVVTAGDGEQAGECLKKGVFDIMLLDILMPKKDGFAVLSEVKLNPTLKEMPVIILSNLGRKEHIGKAMDMGAEDYIIKTQFTPQEVFEKIEKVLTKKG